MRAPAVRGYVLVTHTLYGCCSTARSRTTRIYALLLLAGLPHYWFLRIHRVGLVTLPGSHRLVYLWFCGWFFALPATVLVLRITSSRWFCRLFATRWFWFPIHTPRTVSYATHLPAAAHHAVVRIMHLRLLPFTRLVTAQLLRGWFTRLPLPLRYGCQFPVRVAFVVLRLHTVTVAPRGSVITTYGLPPRLLRVYTRLPCVVTCGCVYACRCGSLHGCLPTRGYYHSIHAYGSAARFYRTRIAWLRFPHHYTCRTFCYPDYLPDYPTVTRRLRLPAVAFYILPPQFCGWVTVHVVCGSHSLPVAFLVAFKCVTCHTPPIAAHCRISYRTRFYLRLRSIAQFTTGCYAFVPPLRCLRFRSRATHLVTVTVHTPAVTRWFCRLYGWILTCVTFTLRLHLRTALPAVARAFAVTVVYVRLPVTTRCYAFYAFWFTVTVTLVTVPATDTLQCLPRLHAHGYSAGWFTGSRFAVYVYIYVVIRWLPVGYIPPFTLVYVLRLPRVATFPVTALRLHAHSLRLRYACYTRFGYVTTCTRTFAHVWFCGCGYTRYHAVPHLRLPYGCCYGWSWLCCRTFTGSAVVPALLRGCLRFLRLRLPVGSPTHCVLGYTFCGYQFTTHHCLHALVDYCTTVVLPRTRCQYRSCYCCGLPFCGYHLAVRTTRTLRYIRGYLHLRFTPLPYLTRFTALPAVLRLYGWLRVTRVVLHPYHTLHAGYGSAVDTTRTVARFFYVPVCV